MRKNKTTINKINCNEWKDGGEKPRKYNQNRWKTVQGFKHQKQDEKFDPRI